MWHRFGQGFGQMMNRVAERAERDKTPALSTRHLLLALVDERGLPAAQMLTALGVTPKAVQEALERLTSAEDLTGGDVPTLTAQAREAIEGSYQLAEEFGDQYIGGEHLLLVFVRNPDRSDAGRALAQIGVTWPKAGRMLMAQQKWRICPPQGVSLPDLPARRLLRSLRKKAGQLKRLTYGVTHYRKPFMPYVVFRKRSTDNPYPFYTRLRCQPPYWDPLLNQWVVTRYQDVVAALASPHLSQRIYSAPAWSHEDLPPLVQREFRCLQNSLDQQMLFQDAPAQPRQRLLVAKRFTPRVIAQMQDQMQQIASELLDAAEPAGHMDVIADLAVPFPLLVITRMLGLPSDELARFKKWSSDYFKYLTFETTLADDLAAHRSVQEAAAYFRALLPARRQQRTDASLPDDLITLLLQADDEGKLLPEDEVVSNCLLLLATGHENTTRLISSGVLALMRHPEQWRQLCADPSLVGSAVEEMLRFDSPVQWTLRYLQADMNWQGCAMKKGQRVLVGIGPANHDPAQFPEADRLDITRAANRHVAFGQGAHFCLGAALARLEAQTVFRCLTTRFPHLRLLKSPQWRQEGLAFRGLQTLHVRWDTERNVMQNENDKPQGTAMLRTQGN